MGYSFISLDSSSVSNISRLWPDETTLSERLQVGAHELDNVVVVVVLFIAT